MGGIHKLNCLLETGEDADCKHYFVIIQIDAISALRFLVFFGTRIQKDKTRVN